MPTDAIVILTNCPNEDVAERIAGALVQAGLAACVNQLARVRSTFRWQGKVEREDEVPLLIKTIAARYSEVEAAIRSLHPYAVPEIIAVPVLAGYAPYLRWIADSTAEGGMTLA